MILAFLFSAATVAPAPGIPALADPRYASRDETLTAMKAADAALAAADQAYANEITLRLNSAKPYETLLAVRRLRAVPQLVDQKVLARLIALCSNTAPLVASQQCLVASKPGADQQCATTSLAREARDLLIDLERPDEVAQAIVARITSVPGAAADLAPLVEPAFVPSKIQLLNLVRDAKSVDEQAALLLLASEMRCASSDVEPAIVRPFLTSLSPEVRVRAALVVLKRSDGCDQTAASVANGARQEALKVLNDALAREQPPTLMVDIGRLGITASPLMPVLLKKLDSPLVATVQAFAAMKYRARPAVPRLVQLLEDPRLGSLHPDILRALSQIRPSPDKARSGILKAIQRSVAVLPEGARALADIEAPTSPSEFEYLNRLYRKECVDAEPESARAERCSDLVASLTSLGARGNHVFVPLGAP